MHHELSSVHCQHSIPDTQLQQTMMQHCTECVSYEKQPAGVQHAYSEGTAFSYPQQQGTVFSKELISALLQCTGPYTPGISVLVPESIL